MTQLTATFTVTIKTKPDGDYYFDHDDLVRNVVPWIEGGLDDRDDIAEVTITEQATEEAHAELRHARAALARIRQMADYAESAAVSAAVAPPTNQTALRDRIRLAIARQWLDEMGSDRTVDELDAAEFGEFADAVLAVLPEPADRAAIYAEVAERLATDAEQGDKDGLTRIYRRSAAKQVREWADRLRRVADETATETPAPDDRRLHACTQFGTWFDRSICAEPCGAMHTRCTECGVALDACPQQSAAGARQDGGQS
jgi:hypothetical protein